MSKQTIVGIVVGLVIGISATVSFLAVRTVLSMQTQLNDASAKANATYQFISEQIQAQQSKK